MGAVDDVQMATAIAALTSALHARTPLVQEEPDTVFTVEEAAERLGVSRSLIYTLMRRGELHTIKIGRHRFIPVDEVERIVRGEAT